MFRKCARFSRECITYSYLFASTKTKHKYKPLYTSASVYFAKNKSEERKLLPLDVFESAPEKNKKNFWLAIQFFHEKDTHYRGQVEFIYSALKFMDEFGVNKDIDTYIKLLNLFPKGRMVPENKIQVAFMHFPRHQQCAVDVLQKMESSGICPTREVMELLKNIFGNLSYPVRKCGRMLYWMPKMKNLSPWRLPSSVPDDTLELVMLAMRRLSSVDVTAQLKIYKAEELEDSIDPTWIVSSFSPIQQKLVQRLSAQQIIYVEGAFRVWLRKSSVAYFILRTEPCSKQDVVRNLDDVSNLYSPYFNPTLSVPALYAEEQSVHEQADGTILAMCATGTSSQDSLLSWIRFLEKECPKLAQIPIVFTSKSPVGNLVSQKLEKVDSDNPDLQEVSKLHLRDSRISNMSDYTEIT